MPRKAQKRPDGWFWYSAEELASIAKGPKAHAKWSAEQVARRTAESAERAREKAVARGARIRATNAARMRAYRTRERQIRGSLEHEVTDVKTQAVTVEEPHETLPRADPGPDQSSHFRGPGYGGYRRHEPGGGRRRRSLIQSNPTPTRRSGRQPSGSTGSMVSLSIPSHPTADGL